MVYIRYLTSTGLACRYCCVSHCRWPSTSKH